MIDVHVLTNPYAFDIHKQGLWFSQCKKSLEHHSNINVHILPGIRDHVGQGRANGFSRGNSPYVSFVDDDDAVRPEVFERCEFFLNHNPDKAGVCTREEVICDNGTSYFSPYYYDKQDDLNYKSINYVHHLVVLRREIIEQYMDFLTQTPYAPEYMLWTEMWNDGHKIDFLNFVGYQWRHHDDGFHNKKHTATEEQKQRYGELMNSFSEHYFNTNPKVTAKERGYVASVGNDECSSCSISE